MKRRYLAGLLSFLTGVLLAVGCGPAVKESELGEIQRKASELPAAGEEHPLPDPTYAPPPREGEDDLDLDSAEGDSA